METLPGSEHSARSAAPAARGACATDPPVTSLLPKLEDMLVDLLQFGDTGALRISLGLRQWTLFVQGGVLVGIDRAPGWEPPPPDGEDPARRLLVEALSAQGAIIEFAEGQGPADFGLYDVRLALGEALGEARPTHVLLEMLKPVLEGWPELRADPDTLSSDPRVQAWLASLDGLGLGNTRLLYAPPRPGPALGALWVAWKLGDLDLHAAAIDDEDLSGSFRARAPAPSAAPVEGAAFDDQEEAHDEETARSHGTAPTWTTAHTHRSAGPEGPGILRRPPRDPFLEGVSRARAGQPVEALPLLEAAWEEDPERPGLEEWLGYTRFAALRESDPEKAKAGLAALREVMYRTGPTSETPILPWTLMARAQYERGDMVQARSLIDTVLQREPDDPEAMHLDGLIRQAEARMAEIRSGPPPVSWRRIAGLTGGVAVLAALVTVLRVADQPRPTRDDYASAYQDVLPLRELHHLSGGWVGVVLPGWEGEGDPARALAACQELARRAAMDRQDTLFLLSDAGAPLAECGDRLR